MGSSTGGREALLVAQRHPRDYDGIFSQVPVHPFAYTALIDELLRTQAQAGDAWIPPAKVSVIGKEVLRQCDELDGLADGLVSNYVVCNRKFDPAVSPDALVAVRCPDGRDTAETCLSDAQIKAANALRATVHLPFPLANGWSTIPGWTTGGELPTNFRNVTRAATRETRTTGMLAGLVVRNPELALLDVKLADYKARIQELSALTDATDPDLSAFRSRGGKLIMKVNTTDYAANPRWSYAYYDKVVERMKQPVVDSFVRFYVAVGIFHNRNVGRNPITNEIVPAYVDFIAMLDDWVETGKPPADAPALVSMDTAPPFTVRASLPMCRYPQYPRYAGKGDPKDAASYACTKP
jgi:feruloyl esterase